MLAERCVGRHCGLSCNAPRTVSHTRACAVLSGGHGCFSTLQAPGPLPRDYRCSSVRMSVASGPQARLVECTWQPPSEPDAPRVAPEYTPPSDPGTRFRPPPEYAPPEQRPDEEPRRGDRPMRPIRPDQEPNIPDPESPNADPVRTPERRKEVTEPAPQERPDERPERE